MEVQLIEDETNMDKTNILLVEDDKNMREALYEILDSAGYAVTATSDGTEALAHANGHLPHLVITDLVMPDKTGVEFIRSIRKSGGELSKVPILVLTGYDGMVVYGAKLAGANKVLKKPNDLEHLTEAITELLQAAAV